MAKYFSSIFLLFFISYGVQAQKFHLIDLIKVEMNIDNRDFYIEKVIDKRDNKLTIGYTQIGLFNKRIPILVEGLIENQLMDYFNKVIPRQGYQVGVTIIIRELNLTEQSDFSNEMAKADLAFDYYLGTSKVYSNSVLLIKKGLDVTKLHAKNIQDALEDIILDFNGSTWNSTEINDSYYENGADFTEIKTTPQKQIERNKSVNNKPVMAIGYNIGGYTLVGFNYEIPVSEFIGIHGGLGIVGYTAGIKIHPNKRKNAFINLSYKDLGFGMANTIGAEYGGAILFNKYKNNFGLLIQGGFGIVTNMEPWIVDEYYKGIKPDILITFGIGLRF